MAKKKPGVQRGKPPPEPEEENDGLSRPGEEEEPKEEEPPEEEAGPAQDAGENELEEEDGTLASGYAEDGPYHCGDCIHFVPTGNVCTHSVVVADPALQMRRRGDAMPVDAERGCCRYVRPAQKAGPVSEQVVRP